MIRHKTQRDQAVGYSGRIRTEQNQNDGTQYGHGESFLDTRKRKRGEITTIKDKKKLSSQLDEI